MLKSNNLRKNSLLLALIAMFSLLAPAVMAEEEAAAIMPVYIELKPDFIVNYSASGPKLRYIKAAISLRSDSAQSGAIQGNMPIVRDAVVMYLSSRTADQVNGAIAREQTRKDAVEAINTALKDETGMTPVMDVLFTSFVTQ